VFKWEILDGLWSELDYTRQEYKLPLMTYEHGYRNHWIMIG
jgi:hypothetical protein